MKKFVPYEKMSKKAKKKMNAQKRNDWGNINPVTRCEKGVTEYQRCPKHRTYEFEDF